MILPDLNNRENHKKLWSQENSLALY